LQTEVRAPVASDEFAPELGARLSVLVRDGIEHAQLRLNPADLGPIEVRIDLDGQRAQVDFSAAHATTRQALQDAVPALAGALREQGLTLTGGGVFEQPREQRGEGSPRDARQAAASKDRSADDARPVITAPRVPRARGVVDIYA
jgi:flagellar hook-length control protein FliK